MSSTYSFPLPITRCSLTVMKWSPIFFQKWQYPGRQRARLLKSWQTQGLNFFRRSHWISHFFTADLLWIDTQGTTSSLLTLASTGINIPRRYHTVKSIENSFKVHGFPPTALTLEFVISLHFWCPQSCVWFMLPKPGYKHLSSVSPNTVLHQEEMFCLVRGKK